MRNYFVQLQELKIAEARLITLEERKIRLTNKIISCTKELKDNSGSSSSTNDKMVQYMINLEKIESEIAHLEEEIKCLKLNLEIMEQALEKINGIEQKIFLLRYKNHLKVKEIAKELNYSIGRVYQYLDKIDGLIDQKSKDYKKL